MENEQKIIDTMEEALSKSMIVHHKFNLSPTYVDTMKNILDALVELNIPNADKAKTLFLQGLGGK